MGSTDAAFTGSVPALYHRCLGPLLFEPYARVMAERVAAIQPGDILETAAGTGIVTQALAEALPASRIEATDLNQAMLDVTTAQGAAINVRFSAADAQALPYPDASFDAVVCQFGVMFFPDRVQAYREARRVLRPGGRFLFNVWDRLERNPASAAVAAAVAGVFPDDPPSFLNRVPFGYHDSAVVEGDLHAAGFTTVEHEIVAACGLIGSADDAAVGLCSGTPLGAEIAARDPSRLPTAIAAAAQALRQLAAQGETTPLSARHFTAYG